MSDNEQQVQSRPQSPEFAPQAQRSPSRQRRGRSRTPRSQSIGSEASMEEAPPPQARRRRRGGQGGQQGGLGGGLPAVGEVDDLGTYILFLRSDRAIG